MIQVSKRCEYCGAFFSLKERKKNRKNKFCSRECSQASRKGVRTGTWVVLKCKECGKEFEKSIGYVRKGGDGNSLGSFCSNECRNIFRDKKIDKTCLACGMTFHGHVNSSFCSVDCYIGHRKVGNYPTYNVIMKNGENIGVRSRWEAVFIKDYLEKNHLDWEYEPKVFTLNDGTRYIPDFYIGDLDLWVEIKGRDDGSGIEKVNKFRFLDKNVVYANRYVLENIYRLDLSPRYLDRMCEKVND